MDGKSVDMLKGVLMDAGLNHDVSKSSIYRARRAAAVGGANKSGVLKSTPKRKRQTEGEGREKAVGSAPTPSSQSAATYATFTDRAQKVIKEMTTAGVLSEDECFEGVCMIAADDGLAKQFAVMGSHALCRRLFDSSRRQHSRRGDEVGEK